MRLSIAVAMLNLKKTPDVVRQKYVSCCSICRRLFSPEQEWGVTAYCPGSHCLCGEQGHSCYCCCAELLWESSPAPGAVGCSSGGGALADT